MCPRLIDWRCPVAALVRTCACQSPPLLSSVGWRRAIQVGGDGRSACYNPDPSLSVGSHPEWCTDFEPGYSEHVRKACPKTCKLCGQPAACVDASAAEVSAATKGTVPDCQAAKLLGV